MALVDASVTTAKLISTTGSGAVVLGASPTLTTPNINSAQFATVSGTAPIYPCRAWVSFIGTGTVTIRASGNVSSISDNGTGNYTVNFTTALPDANYSAVATGDATTALLAGTLSSAVAPTTTAIRIVTYNGAGAGTDCGFCNVAVFR
jgi:hypothetical protein